MSSQTGDGLAGQPGRQWPSVPVKATGDLGDPLSLDRPGQHHGGPVGFLADVAERLVDGGHVMAVDDDRPAAEGLHPTAVGVEVPPERRLSLLAQAVDVDDRRQVRQLVVGSFVEGLPHRALGQLAVTAQHPDPVGHLVEAPAGQGDAHSDGKSLTDRPGGDAHPGQVRARVAVQLRAGPAVGGEQLVVAHDADGFEDGVEQHRGVALGEHQVVVGLRGRARPVVGQVTGHQHGHEIGRRQARRGVTGAGVGGAEDGIDPQLLGQGVEVSRLARIDDTPAGGDRSAVRRAHVAAARSAHPSKFA